MTGPTRSPRDRGGHTQLLSTQRPSGDAVLGAGVVDAAGSAMIYRLPFNGGYRVWRWSDSGPAASPGSGRRRGPAGLALAVRLPARGRGAGLTAIVRSTI